jgi:hypothetical protein
MSGKASVSVTKIANYKMQILKQILCTNITDPDFNLAFGMIPKRRITMCIYGKIQIYFSITKISGARTQYSKTMWFLLLLLKP